MKQVDYISLKSRLDTDEEADFRYQERRHPQWTENYQLYRDTVIVNRLTQRQSINVPLMKGTIKTILANIDEFPDIEFEELGNEKDKGIVFNELWKDFVIKDKLEIKDIVDKKQVLLYGISWTKFNIVQGRITTEIKEPFDILVDRYADPSDLDNTADHIIERGIFRTLDELASDPSYDSDAIERLKLFYGTQAGLIKAEEAARYLEAKNQRLAEMGAPDLNNPQIGHTVVELKIHYKRIWDEADEKFYWHAIVVAGSEVLSGKPMLEILGINASPLVKWSDDPERNDQYPDGVADIVRNPNKLLNANVSALAENRIMRNMGMNFYDATANESWVPQSLEPMPFGWYPLPGKPSEVYQKVDIPDLSDSLDEMQYVQSVIESATAATAATKGDTEQRKVTLGEVELAVGAAKERISSTAKFAMLAQREKGDKFAKIVNANADKLDAITLYKKSHKGNYFSKTVTGKDYKSDSGYTCRVVSTAERQKESVESIQKLNAAKQNFPVNPVFKKIYDKKLLEFAGVNPDETQAVLEYEEQLVKTPMIPGAVPQLTPPQNAFTPQAA